MATSEYADKGFQVVPDYFAHDDIMVIRNTISELVLNQIETLSDDQRAKFDGMEYEELTQEGVKQLARIDNVHLRQINDQLYASPFHLRLMTQDRVLDLAREFVGASRKEHLGMVGFSFRLDLPNSFAEQEARLSQPWHQDSAYYLTKACPETSAVFWIPIYDCGVEEGCLETLEASQHLGPVEHVQSSKDYGDGRRSHTRLTVPQKTIDDSGCELAFLEANAGDAGVIHINLIHRSGTNHSDKVRYTLLARFSNMLSPTYIP